MRTQVLFGTVGSGDVLPGTPRGHIIGPAVGHGLRDVDTNANASEGVLFVGGAGRHTAPKPPRHAANAKDWRDLSGRRDRDSDPFRATWRSAEECPEDWYAVLGVEPTATATEISYGMVWACASGMAP